MIIMVLFCLLRAVVFENMLNNYKKYLQISLFLLYCVEAILYHRPHISTIADVLHFLLPR